MAPQAPDMGNKRKGPSWIARKFDWLTVEGMSLVAWIALFAMYKLHGYRLNRQKETRWTKWR